jgi:hypothetical protein
METYKALAAGLLLIGLMLAGTPARADVFRCTDRGGKISYQSLPCPEAHAAKRLELGQGETARTVPAKPPTPSATAVHLSRERASSGWGIVFLDDAMDLPAPAAAPTPAPAAVYASPSARPAHPMSASLPSKR